MYYSTLEHDGTRICYFYQDSLDFDPKMAATRNDPAGQAVALP
jgi:hypothetical protein